jgi:hypothetical protein
MAENSSHPLCGWSLTQPVLEKGKRKNPYSAHSGRQNAFLKHYHSRGFRIAMSSLIGYWPQAVRRQDLINE